MEGLGKKINFSRAKTRVGFKDGLMNQIYGDNHGTAKFVGIKASQIVRFFAEYAHDVSTEHLGGWVFNVCESIVFLLAATYGGRKNQIRGELLRSFIVSSESLLGAFILPGLLNCLFNA